MLETLPSTCFKMDTTIPAKRFKRLEKKKQKVAAFLELIKSTSSESENGPLENSNSTHAPSPTSSTGMGQWTPVVKTNTRAVDPDTYNISTEEYLQLKKDLKKRKKFFLTKPNLHLKEVGEAASISLKEPGKIVPLFSADIQHLLFFPLFGGPYHPPYLPPRWCYFERSHKVSQIVIFIVEGASSYTFSSNESQLPTLSNDFEIKTEFISPYCYGSDIVTDLSVVKLSKLEDEKLSKRFGKIAFLEPTADEYKKLKSAFPINFDNAFSKVPETVLKSVNPPVDNESLPVSSPVSSLPLTDKFSRVLLLLSPRQMLDENYPLPLPGELRSKYVDYKFTKDEYSEVTSHSPMFGLDCEMCITAEGHELTRIALVNEKHEVLYDCLVKPRNNIIDYLTQYSGVTKKMLADVTKRLEDVQDDMRAILPADAILIGQSLNMDLQAMKMMHPYVIDTSVIFNVSGVRRMKPKLSLLASEFLGMDIQSSKSGHDSVEDSLAALKLVQLKLTSGLDFGDAVTSVISDVKTKIEETSAVKNQRKKSDLNETQIILEYWKRNPYKISSIFRHIILDKKSAAVFGCSDVMKDYSEYLPDTPDMSEMRTVVTSNNAKTVSETCSQAKNYLFSVSHITIDPDHHNETLSDIDRWCKEIKDTVLDNGLFIVLFPGSKNNNANGLAFIKIIQPPCPITTRNSRTIQ